MKKHFAKIAVVLVLMTSFFSGCSFKDIDKRIFVQGIAIDYTEDKEKPYRITLKLAVPTGSLKESQGAKYSYLSREDSSLAGAIRILKTHTDKELDFGHSRIIIFGEKLIDHNINEVTDFLFRRRDIQMIAWVAVGDPSAEEVLKVETPSEMAASPTLTNLFSQNGVESAYIVSTFLFDLRRKTFEPGIDPILPIIRVNKEKNKIMVNQSVVFKKHNEHVHLSSKFTKSYNVLSNDINKYDLRVKGEDHQFIFSVDSVDVKYKIDTSSLEQPIIKMKIQIAGIIEESFKDLSPKELDKYSKFASNTAKENVHEFLTAMQKENIDPLGFGLRYRATRLAQQDTLSQWENIYPNVKFEIHVDAKVKSTGTIE
ncbi:Ger(x)C family spore germination protein [Bacillus niameyensis]|uniref:Ger(x)C family spore germination protein n=1 Tax=Bacillus niameyensis TaxID=1522308 RepID=UPI0007857D10|nr:Ger(x)C family spore germination protein [Bacillus niameyensis]